MPQLALDFAVPPAPPPADAQLYPEESRLDRAFAEFHEQNPEVYLRLVKLARDLRARGHKRLGIGMLFEVIRWMHYMETFDVAGYKLNNNHRSRYSRLIMASELDLGDVFETRELADEKAA